LDLILPKAKGKTTSQQNVAVSITENQDYYINEEKVSEGSIERLLKAELSGIEEPTIILRAAEGVPIEKAVQIMDIANRNKYKIVLAVKPK
jgi:biopolymer transport protein ExbD